MNEDEIQSSLGLKSYTYGNIVSPWFENGDVTISNVRGMAAVAGCKYCHRSYVIRIRVKNLSSLLRKFTLKNEQLTRRYIPISLSLRQITSHLPKLLYY